MSTCFQEVWGWVRWNWITVHQTIPRFLVLILNHIHTMFHQKSQKIIWNSTDFTLGVKFYSKMRKYLIAISIPKCNTDLVSSINRWSTACFNRHRVRTAPSILYKHKTTTTRKGFTSLKSKITRIAQKPTSIIHHQNRKSNHTLQISTKRTNGWF